MEALLFLVTFALCLPILAQEPTGLTGRSNNYFETAIAVTNERSEIVTVDGRKYRVLLQDIESKNTKPKTLKNRASGFFIYHQSEYYFATAQHVAKNMTPRSRLAFLNSKGESCQIIFGKLVGTADKFVWRHHEETDVSLLKLHLPEEGVKEVADIAIPTEHFYPKPPPRTSKLIVAGFPGGLGTLEGKVSPITAVVHLASEEIPLNVELKGISIKSAYLVNPPAGKGFSGAPIFYILPDGTVRCVGMLNGAWSDPTGGKFSISVPARFLFDLVDQ